VLQVENNSLSKRNEQLKLKQDGKYYDENKRLKERNKNLGTKLKSEEIYVKKILKWIRGKKANSCIKLLAVNFEDVIVHRHYEN